MTRQRVSWWIVAAGALALGPIVACHSMQPIEPSQLVATNIPRVRVTRVDNGQFELHAPRVTGDTLAGFVDGQYREMLLSETQRLEARRPAAARTAVLGAVTGATALAAFIYMANRNYVGDGQTCYTARDGTPVPCCAGKSTISC